MASRAIAQTIPIGLAGLHGSRNPSQLGPAHGSYFEGVDLDGGEIIKDGGVANLNSVELGSGATILAGINWSPQPGDDHDVLMLDTGAVLKDTGAGTFGTSLTTGLNAPSIYPPSFTLGGGETAGGDRKLFLYSEGNQVQVVVGTADTMAAIGTPPADWATSFPLFGVLHLNRMWSGGNASDPHRIYYSTTGDHEDYQGAGSGTLAVYPGEGTQLVAGISVRGFLVLWKYPLGIYLVDARDPDSSNWRVDRLTRAVGGVNQHCIVQIDNDILYLDRGGRFHLLSATDEPGSFNTSNIGRANDIDTFMRDNVALGNIRKAQGVWYTAKAKAWFGVPRIGSADNDLRIIIDFNSQELGPRFLVSRRDIPISLWMRPDSEGIEIPVIGDDSGFVKLMDQDERSNDGQAYTMRLETSEIDFSFIDPSLGTLSKNGEFLEITADLIRNTYLNVIPVWDGNEGVPIQFTIGSEGNVLGNFKLGVDALAGAGIVNVRRKLKGSGRRLKLILENNILNDELRIAEVKVTFGTGDERTT
jgi:hypothetical protein